MILRLAISLVEPKGNSIDTDVLLPKYFDVVGKKLKVCTDLFDT